MPKTTEELMESRINVHNSRRGRLLANFLSWPPSQMTRNLNRLEDLSYTIYHEKEALENYRREARRN